MYSPEIYAEFITYQISINWGHLMCLSTRILSKDHLLNQYLNPRIFMYIFELESSEYICLYKPPEWEKYQTNDIDH